MTTETTAVPNPPDSPETPGASLPADTSDAQQSPAAPLEETADEVVVPDPPEMNRDWMSNVPQDWTQWTALRHEVCDSPGSRTSFRNWMMNKLADDQHLERGLGLAAAGEDSLALESLRQADGELARLISAQCLISSGSNTEAEALLKDLTGSAAVGLAACLKLADLHFHRRDGEALLADAAALSAAGGGAADTAYLEGLIAEAEGEHEQALAAWQRALEADPDHTEATFRLATLLDRFGDDEAALSLLDRFRSGELPTHTGALMNLGVLYEDREQYDWAAACFRMVVAGEPSNAWAQRSLTDAVAGINQYHDESQERNADKQNAVLRIPVTDFELSVRARNCLQRMNLHTLGDLVSRTESELLSFKNFGETSLEEVKQILSLKGLRLGMITGMGGAIETSDLSAQPSSSGDGEAKDLNVSELDLSVRSRAALATLGVTRVEDLCRTSETTLLSCKNFGQTSLDEIKSKLRSLGMELTG